MTDNDFLVLIMVSTIAAILIPPSSTDTKEAL